MGHRGRIRLVSRHGRWPAAHADVPRPCSATDRFDLVGFDARPTARSIVAAVRRALAQRGDDDWRTIVDQMRPHTVRLWRALDDVERKRLIRHARPLWEAHRHRMAPTIAQRLHEIIATGRVSTMAGRVRMIVGDEHSTTVHIDGHHDTWACDTTWVINCTGPSSEIRRRDDALVCALLTGGHAAPGWRGWGFDVDADGRLQHCSELGRTFISALGPLRLGADYETTAIPEIRVQAAALACRLVTRPQRADVA
jgi:uncharacterized NAD(P)/FAD-binding protein YdhS